MAYSSEHVRTATVKSSVHGKELLHSMNSGTFFFLSLPVHCTVCCTGWSVLSPLPFERPAGHQELMITVSMRQTPH